MSSAIFEHVRDDDSGALFAPSGHARGPWDVGAMHGGAPAALIAREVERLPTPAPMLLARLTVEFLRGVPLAPVTVRARLVRPGRRLCLAEAAVACDGTDVCVARAVLLRRELVGLPPGATPAVRIAPPGELAPWQMGPPPHGASEGFGPTAVELRFAAGHFTVPGPATAWFRLLMPLVAGEETTPVQSAIAAADFGNGLSASLGFDTHIFVNTELTVHLARDPAADGWIAVEGVTEHGPEGTALAASTLHDTAGPLGRAAQSLFVSER